MSEPMNLVGAHSGPVRWLSGVLAALLLVVGVAVGIGRAPQPQSTLTDGSFQAQPVAARLPAARHSVVGVVRAVGPNEILVRSQRGTFFAIKWGPESHFRAGGRDIEPAAIRPGQSVVVIGKPAPDGSLAASYVTVVPRATTVQPADGS